MDFCPLPPLPCVLLFGFVNAGFFCCCLYFFNFAFTRYGLAMFGKQGCSQNLVLCGFLKRSCVCMHVNVKAARSARQLNIYRGLNHFFFFPRYTFEKGGQMLSEAYEYICAV